MTTDRKMLEDCLAAFEALNSNAAACRKLLRLWSEQPGTYAGSGQNLLAAHMVAKLKKHLKENSL